MTNRTTNVAVAKSGDKFMAAVQEQHSDAPLLPVKDIQALKDVCPDAVQLILDETRKEAEFRRRVTEKEQGKYYFQRGMGQVFALIIGLAGIAGGVYCVRLDYPNAGGTIASLAIVSLALAFLGRKQGK